jgi:hypothetical protein
VNGFSSSPDVIWHKGGVIAEEHTHHVPGSDHRPLTCRVALGLAELHAATAVAKQHTGIQGVSWRKVTAARGKKFTEAVGKSLADGFDANETPERATRRLIRTLQHYSRKHLPQRSHALGSRTSTTMAAAGRELIDAETTLRALRQLHRATTEDVALYSTWEQTARVYLAGHGVCLPADGTIPQSAFNTAGDAGDNTSAQVMQSGAMHAAYRTMVDAREATALLAGALVVDATSMASPPSTSGVRQRVVAARLDVKQRRTAWTRECDDAVASPFRKAATRGCRDDVGWEIRKLLRGSESRRLKIRAPTAAGNLLRTERAQVTAFAAVYRKKHGAFPQETRAPLPPPSPPPPPTTMTELTASIAAMRLRRSPGADGICAEHLRLLDDRALRYLLALTDLIINKGVPQILKHSIVVPVYKGNNKDPTLATSFRPVSLVSTVSKCVESVVSRRINELLPDGNLQEGYRPAGSTTTCISRFLTAAQDGLVTSQIVNGRTVSSMVTLLTALDFSDAFLIPSPPAMVAELGRTAAVKPYLPFVSSFMADRTFAVRVGAATSAKRQAPNGVPQGAVFSSLCAWNGFLNHALHRLDDIIREQVVQGNADARADIATALQAAHDAAEQQSTAATPHTKCVYETDDGSLCARQRAANGDLCIAHKRLLASRRTATPGTTGTAQTPLSQFAIDRCVARKGYTGRCKNTAAQPGNRCARCADLHRAAIARALDGQACRRLHPVTGECCGTQVINSGNYCSTHDPVAVAGRTPDAITSGGCGAYADDVHAWLTGRDFERLHSTMQRVLSRWEPTVQALGLPLSTKSVALQISNTAAGSGKHVRMTEPLRLCGLEISVASNDVKLVGLHVDKYLRFGKHADELHFEMARALNELRHLAVWLPAHVLASIWKATGLGLFTSSMPALWFERAEIAMQARLASVHAAACRIITDSTATSHAASAIAEAGCESLGTMARLASIDAFHNAVRLPDTHPLRQAVAVSGPLVCKTEVQHFAATTRLATAYMTASPANNAGSRTPLSPVTRLPLMRRLPYRADATGCADRVTILAKPAVPDVTTKSPAAARTAANTAQRTKVGDTDWLCASDGSVDCVKLNPALSATVPANGAAAVIYKRPVWRDGALWCRPATARRTRRRSRLTPAEHLPPIHVAATAEACSFSAESHGLLALLQRLHTLLRGGQRTNHTVAIYCDTQSVLSMLERGPLRQRTPFGAALWAALLALAPLTQRITVAFVFGHVEFPPNDAADLAAGVAGGMMARGELPQPPLWHADEVAPLKTAVRCAAALRSHGSIRDGATVDHDWLTQVLLRGPRVDVPRGGHPNVATCFKQGRRLLAAAVPVPAGPSQQPAVEQDLRAAFDAAADDGDLLPGVAANAAASKVAEDDVEAERPGARPCFRARHRPVHESTLVANGRTTIMPRYMTRAGARMLSALRVGCCAKLGGNLHSLPEQCYRCAAPAALARDGAAVEHLFACTNSACVAKRKAMRLTTSPSQLWGPGKLPEKTVAYARWFASVRQPAAANTPAAPTAPL